MSPIFTYDPKTFDPGDFQAQAQAQAPTPTYASLVVRAMQSNGFLQTMMLPQ